MKTHTILKSFLLLSSLSSFAEYPSLRSGFSANCTPQNKNNPQIQIDFDQKVEVSREGQSYQLNDHASYNFGKNIIEVGGIVTPAPLVDIELNRYLEATSTDVTQDEGSFTIETEKAIKVKKDGSRKGGKYFYFKARFTDISQREPGLYDATGEIVASHFLGKKKVKNWDCDLTEMGSLFATRHTNYAPFFEEEK